ncbi:MAG TPA: hypothetical protein VGF07_04705 [Stellaceae bacterium]|jgi:hypothetical protein
MAAIDTLQLSRVLRDRAGFSQDAAEATAEALGAAIGGELATKSDLAALRTELKADIAELRTEIISIKSDIRLLRWQIAVTWALSLAILVKLFVH